jgi:hypothetical protein
MENFPEPKILESPDLSGVKTPRRDEDPPRIMQALIFFSVGSCRLLIRAEMSCPMNHMCIMIFPALRSVHQQEGSAHGMLP